MNAYELRAEIARLRGGEADAPAEPGLVPTPAQWIRKWNDGTAEQRLKWAALAIAHMEEASRCFQEDHEGRLQDLRGALARRSAGTVPLPPPQAMDERQNEAGHGE